MESVVDVTHLPDPNTMPLSSFIEAFASFRDDHLDALNQCTNGGHVPIDAVRHLVTAALRRSAAMVEGFLSLIDDKNRFAAIPLIRLQIDSAMRVHACGLVNDPSDFVKHVLEGGEPRKYRGSGKLDLTDKALHTALTKKYPQTTELYQDTNGYIHLSNHHLFGVFDQEQLRAGTAIFTDHDLLPPWDEADRKGAMVSMLWATHVLTEECSVLLEQHPKDSD